MSSMLAMSPALLRALPRIAFLVLLLGAPVLAMPNTQAAGGTLVEGIHKKSSGFGFVLLISLQR